MNWMRKVVMLGVALSWLAGVPAWAADGYIFDAAGEVSMAMDKSVAQRVAKNDEVSPGAVITTGDKSYVVLKFEDGQVVTLQSNSTFQVREYRYVAAQPEQSSIFFSMLKGGMRFVTGLIGRNNKDAFRLATPNATIGIRGTEFMVAMGNNSMYSQVVSGSISMTNAAGTVALGAGQVAVVASATTLASVIPVSALPAGTFSQLGTIPVPSATPASTPAGGSAAGGATAGGAGTATTATAGAAAGVSTTAIAIGVGVAAGVAAMSDNTTTTTHH